LLIPDDGKGVLSTILGYHKVLRMSFHCSIVRSKNVVLTILIHAALVLAVAGLIAMLVIHVASLFAITYPFDRSLKFLVPGVFVLALPTIFVMNVLTRDFKQKDIWRAALRGCPKWMRRAVWIIFGYAWAGFFALPFLYGGGMNSPGNTVRVISATLLIFYLILVSVLYSATRVYYFDESRRCLNGHPISALAKFCEECGAPAELSNRG
jgi:hypothetical protein